MSASFQAPGRTLPSPLWLVDRLLYRDGLILILDKPAGVLTRRLT